MFVSLCTSVVLMFCLNLSLIFGCNDVYFSVGSFHVCVCVCVYDFKKIARVPLKHQNDTLALPDSSCCATVFLYYFCFT